MRLSPIVSDCRCRFVSMFAKNTIWNLIYQLTAVIAGFLVPRAIIGVYGSEVNGLVTSLTQFIGYFALVEAGVSGAATFALYKPIAQHDWDSINLVASASRAFYQKSGVVFLLLLVVLSVAYPVFVSAGALSPWEIMALTFLLGAKVVVDFFSLSKYRVFLTADQKNWLIQLASTVYTLLNTGIIIGLSYLHASVVAVYVLALLAVFARSLILFAYTRRRYPQLDCKVEYGDYKLPQRWDALFLQILGAVQSGAPVILATVLCGSMSEVSVLAVYLLVSNGLQMIPNVLGTGLQAMFGRQIAEGDFEALRSSYKPYRALVYAVSAVACGCAFSLILPFVDLYTDGFHDANYHNALLGFLIVLNVFLFHGKSSQGLLVIAAGMYKETRWQTCLQAAFILLLGIPLTSCFGVVGTIAASCISNLYRVVDLLLFEPLRISGESVADSFKSFALYVLQATLIAIPGYFLSGIAGSWATWLVLAFGLMAWGVLVVSGTLALFDLRSFQSIFSRFARKK